MKPTKPYDLVKRLLENTGRQSTKAPPVKDTPRLSAEAPPVKDTPRLSAEAPPVKDTPRLSAEAPRLSAEAPRPPAGSPAPPPQVRLPNPPAPSAAPNSPSGAPVAYRGHLQTDHPDVDLDQLTWDEHAVETGETVDGLMAWTSMLGTGAAAAAKKLGKALPSVVGKATAVANKVGPVAQATLLAADVGRMALSPRYRAQVEADGRSMADASGKDIAWKSLEYVGSRPAATGTFYFGALDEFGRRKANDLLKTQSSNRRAKALNQALAKARHDAEGHY
jgi:hypothetical protein